MPEPLRGEVWFAALDPAPPAVGHEQAGPRPVLIVSVDRYNGGPGVLTVVLPLTRRSRPTFWSVPLQPPEGGVRAVSTILCDQIRIISRQRLLDRWGSVSRATMLEVEARLRLLLGL